MKKRKAGEFYSFVIGEVFNCSVYTGALEKRRSYINGDWHEYPIYMGSNISVYKNKNIKRVFVLFPPIMPAHPKFSQINME